jgi:hypothetical protein
MGEIEKIQQDYGKHRLQTNDTVLALANAKAALENLNASEKLEAKGLTEQEREKRKAEIENKRKEITGQIGNLKNEKAKLAESFSDMSAIFLPQLNPIEAVTQLSDNYPILLFPLRLETRFKSTRNQQQLWLRVYPDDCNINKKEELLSESELKNARSFWIEMWKAAGVETEERGAWRSLVNSYGSGRSAWIIEHYKPTSDKPTKVDATYKVLVVTSPLVLTEAEHTAAKNYWAAVWLAKGDAVKLLETLVVLKNKVGDAKATEIIEKYIPINIGDVIPKDITAEKVLLEKIILPTDEEYTTTQTTWTKAPEAIALPDRFVAIAYTGNNKREILFTQSVKEHLPVGPNPTLEADEQIQKDADGNIIMTEELEWMVDFDKAVACGMATKINLTPQEATRGFDKLFVLGIRLSANETASKTQLEKLFTDHYHSKDGFGLIKQGTPTNNTEDNPSGNSWIDDADESYDRVFKAASSFEEKDEWNEKSDGQKLADSLGIDANILKEVPNASGRDQLEANAINTALFPATLGYFMEEMMHPLFDDRDINATKTFFSNFVSGRGPVPSIRIGKQPYGILPISVYSKLDFGNADIKLAVVSKKVPYLARLHNLIMKMDTTWDELLPQVAHIGKAGDQHQVLLDALALNANSVEFHQRYAQSKPMLYNKLIFQTSFLYAKKINTTIENRGKEILEELGINIGETKLPILEKYFLSQPNLLSGPLVDDIPESEINAIRAYAADGKNYIEWLAASDPKKIQEQNFGGNPAPNALLFLLLKHSLTQTQAHSADRISESDKMNSNKKSFFDPDFLHIQKNEEGKSKYANLFSKNVAVTGSNDMSIADYIYTNTILRESSETIRLRETIDALKVLEKTPTARLERLLIEHLDCCNYRIDAWKTGLVNYKLSEQRANNNNKKNGKGLYLGAYGWLIDVKPENKNLVNVENLSPELNEIFNKGNQTVLQTDNKNLGYIHAPSIDQAATAAILRNAYDSNKSAGTSNPFAINLTSDRVRIAKSFLEGMRNGQSLGALLGYQFERALHDQYNLGNGEVDMFIYPIRKAFPLVADNLITTKSDATDAIQTIEANNVIDGLKFINDIQKKNVLNYPFGLTTLPAQTPQNKKSIDAINTEVKNLINTNDAIADLVLSEQMYQVVKGNFERASGNAEAFSKGGYPPDIDIMNTPRTGVTLTQRVAIQFDAEASATVSPNTIGMTAKSSAEPSINKWLSTLLPNPQNVLCKVIYSSPVKAATTVFISQENIGLQAIDLLYTFNLDTEQAMTELDDRITNYIRYTVSNHPKTEIKIEYTEVVDAIDKTKISFFELAALIKNLRKVIMGSKNLSPSVITLPTAGEQPVFTLNDTQLKARVVALSTNIAAVKTSVENIVTTTKSIASLTETLKNSLNSHITDKIKKETIASQLKLDIQSFLGDASVTNKTRIVDTYEVSIASIAIPLTIATLKTEYGILLDSYITDFSNFDNLVKQTSTSFLQMAMFDNVQTGTGFMHQAINNVYNSVFEKIKTIADRWDKKEIDFTTLMLTYNPAAADEIRISFLQKAERIISSQTSFPVNDIVQYKSDIDTKKGLFVALLAKLKALNNNAKQNVTGFIADAELLIKDVGSFDVISFDIENSVNDLRTEKWMMALLKEDIYVSLNNLAAAIAKKITDSNAFITLADATVINSDKISNIMQAAKALLGDEALLLPQFLLSDAQANEFESSYAASNSLLNFVTNVVNDPEKRIFPVEDWLAGVSRVREKIQHWEGATFLSSAFNAASTMDLTPLQFPFKTADRWAALKFIDETNAADTFTLNNDKLLYTAHFATAFDKTKPQCGIVMDEWTEVIPGKEETTGVAFHYDQPNSEPSQTMLLVVPPKITGNWQWNNIVESMEETLEMAKKRAVSPDDIATTAYAQFLPTTMMAVTLYWITVATNLSLNNNIYQKIKSN